MEDKLMTREEIIKYLEKKIEEFKPEEIEFQFDAGSVAKPSDFIPIAWDTPY